MASWLEYMLIVVVLQLLLYSSFRLARTLARKRALLLNGGLQQDGQLNQTSQSQNCSQAPTTTSSAPRLYTIATVVMTANAGNPARSGENIEHVDDLPPSYEEIILAPPIPKPILSDRPQQV